MLEVSPVRAFSDNYIWLIRTLGDPAGAAVVEPGDARPVEDVLDREGLRLRAIFVTYHHRITSEESASLLQTRGAGTRSGARGQARGKP